MKPKIRTILLSTLFSIGLWVFVSFSNEYTTSFKVPIRFDNINDENALLYQSANRISLTIKGQGWVLAQIVFGPKPAFHISVGENLGTHKVNVRDAISENTWINSTIQVTIISPTDINYTIERAEVKKVPVVSDVIINPKSGYKLVSGISFSPDSVEISGAVSLVNSIKNIHTVTKTFEDLDDKIQTKILLKKRRYLKYSTEFSNVKFDIQKLVDKTFTNVPIVAKNVPNLRELELFPSSINITLRGGLKNLGILTNDSINASVDFNDAFLDTFGAIKPKIDIPDFTTLTNVKPKTLKYIIRQY